MLLALPWLLIRLYARTAQRASNSGTKLSFAEVRERLGYFTTTSAPVDLWLHAVSVGEARLALRLCAAWWQQSRDTRILITTTTATAQQIVRSAQRQHNQLSAGYSPYDLPAVLKRFLRHYRPRLALIVETELWPNTLQALNRSNIPAVLINARMSQRSARAYQRLPYHAQLFFQPLSRVYAQWQADADRLQSLGVDPNKIRVFGSLKLDNPIPENMAARQAQLANKLGLTAGTSLISFASTQPGEEAALLTVFTALLSHPQVKIAIIPRHPHRAEQVRQICSQLQPCLYSQHSPGQHWRLLIVDALGILPEFYAQSKLAVIGGSFVDHGGQNMLEAAALGRATLMGPSDRNFQVITQMLKQAGALVQVNSAAQLQAELVDLLADEARIQAMGVAGREFLQPYQQLYANLARELIDYHGQANREP